MIIGLLCIPAAVFADRYDQFGSPFFWSALIITNDDRPDGTLESTSYSGDSVNTLLETKIHNKALDTSCHFAFGKAVRTLIDGSGRYYTESMTISCYVGTVLVRG